MKKLAIALLLVAMLMISTTLIAIPITRCEEEDPIHIYYQGNKISDGPGPIVWTGPCTTESFTFTVVIQWDSLPDPDKVNWCTVQMVEKSGFGITFVPSSTKLYNPSPNSISVEVTVPVAGLPSGTYYAQIYADVTGQGPKSQPAVAGTNGYFRFVKEVCVPPAQYFNLVVQTDPLGIVEIPGSGTYEKCTYVELTAPEFVEVSDCFRYRFDYWDVDGTPVEGNPITVHMDADHTVTAHYVEQYYLTVKTDPEGLVTIPGEGWYDKGTDVGLTAPEVAGYIFVYWDVDGTPVEGNPITVTMDTCHAATAHYWPELEYKQFVTDSSFNVIERFDTVWTPKDMKKTTFKLASTNPGQFMLNIVIHNTWPEAISPVTITFTIDPDFILKGADPIQVHDGYGKTGNRIPATVNFDPVTRVGTVTIENIDPCTTYYITVHMEYGPAREYFTKTEMLEWKLYHASNTFYCGYRVIVPGPFPFIITSTTSTTIHDPVVVLGLED
ncbi:MAG: hypothetical protein QXX51_07555 [Candidatus Bathyarchaeia archaeon]